MKKLKIELGLALAVLTPSSLAQCAVSLHCFLASLLLPLSMCLLLRLALSSGRLSGVLLLTKLSGLFCRAGGRTPLGSTVDQHC